MSARLLVDGRLARSGSSINVSVDLDLSNPIGVSGPTGAGKTTLLRMIAGLEPDFGGRVEVTLDGQQEIWSEPGRGNLVPVHRRHVGFVFQDSRLFPGRTVQANLDYAIQRARAVGPVQDVDSMIRALKIESLLNQPAELLSGGERQRVAIARTLLSKPKLLLMDEPMAANDNAHRDALIAYLSDWLEKHKIPMIYVSHSFAELRRIVPQCLVMARGRVVAQGGAAEVSILSNESAVEDAGGFFHAATVLSADTVKGVLTVQVSLEDTDSLKRMAAGDRVGFRVGEPASDFGALLQPEPNENERESD